jgi:tRNA1(Val) A37 N6-methylase TrmN6
MPISEDKLLALLKRFDFDPLFCDFQSLGWDAPGSDVTVVVQDARIALRAVAQKRGVQVFLCPPDADGLIPEDKTRRRIAHQLGRHVPENLLIFADAAQTEQLWLYPRRQPGRPQRLIPWRFHKDETNGTLLQKLRAISFTLDEEESLDVFGVTSRLKDALDRDRVTKSFYRDFQSERTSLESFVEGLPDVQQERHYVAILLNRMMFIYFLQNKGFLGNSDTRYLQNRLALSEGRYYRDFLCPLFFAGFAKKEEDRSAKENALLVQVPYLNGGIFAQHQIEAEHATGLNLPDEAFKRLFAFFDQYHWHLDDRPLENGNEINPDVLGYIFEKFINQKQMGAYYTKEDITGYITQNTVIPFLFDAAQKECRIAFENPDGPTVWDLLKSDPDRYIYPSVRKGVDLPLPPEIGVGVDTVAPGLLERRKEWNKPAADAHKLPTEIWRETVARRQRCQELRRKLSGGEVRSVSDLITLNLDIRQFALDVIGNCEDASLLRAFWKSIEKVTVLDPTCGSGAFLFAALDVLEPLYEVCLERMESLVGDEAAKLPPGKLRATAHGVALLPHDKHGDFSKVLDRVAAHVNRRYFIYKSIILRNLYGVDIMEEAIEICKLRLFLKLAAQVSPDPKKRNLGIEPLPDIDFNIRAGNTLVGFASPEEVKKALLPEGELALNDDDFRKVDAQAQKVSLAYQRFRALQTEEGMDSAGFAKAKDDLGFRLKELNFELDTAQAKSQYSINNETLSGNKKFATWKTSHQPFHWYSEFYEIIVGNKGFDVIIGNPPYVVYSEDKVGYRIGQQFYKAFESKNLYSYVAERSTHIASKKGWIGLIVQLTVLCAEKMDTLQDVVFQPFRAGPKQSLMALKCLYPYSFQHRLTRGWRQQGFPGFTQRNGLTLSRSCVFKNTRGVSSPIALLNWGIQSPLLS